MLSISPSALRQWEAAGLTHPSRTAGGYRTYGFDQIDRIKRIQHLRSEQGMSIEAIRQALDGKTHPSTSHPLPAKRPAGPQRIGKRLRHLRKDHKLTLSEAASGMGLSVSFLSCLERDHVHASLATLQKISVFYKSNILSLFGGIETPGRIGKLVRPNQRRKISSEPGVDIELLSFGKAAMECQIFHLAPGASSGGSYHHEGEEFIFMLSGVCDFWLDEVEHHLLREGDCLYFSSQQTHRWSNPGKTRAVLMWVNTPPFF